MSHPSLPVPSRPRIRCGGGTATVFSLLTLLVGCADTPPRHGPGRAEPRQPPLEAKAGFLTDTIQATAQIVAVGVPIRGAGDEPARERGPGGRPPPGGMGMGGGMGHAGGGEHSGRHRSSDEQAADGSGESRPTMRAMGSMPRQTLRITLTNVGSGPVDFTVTELSSAIGNFQPQPDRLRLSPGASATLDPVSGDAGGVLEWLDVTLSLRRAGATESHVLHLTRLPGAEAPPPPPRP